MQLKLCLLVLVIFIGRRLCAEFLTSTFMKYAVYVMLLVQTPVKRVLQPVIRINVGFFHIEFPHSGGCLTCHGLCVRARGCPLSLVHKPHFWTCCWQALFLSILGASTDNCASSNKTRAAITVEFFCSHTS